MEKTDPGKRKLYDPDKFKLIGRESPEKENRVILWLLIGILAAGCFYILSFYV